MTIRWSDYQEVRHSEDLFLRDTWRLRPSSPQHAGKGGMSASNVLRERLYVVISYP